MPAPATLRFEPREGHGPIPPSQRQVATGALRGVTRHRQHRTVSASAAHPSRLFQDGLGRGGHRCVVLVSSLLVFCAPPHHSTFDVDIRPPQLSDGPRSGARSRARARGRRGIASRPAARRREASGQCGHRGGSGCARPSHPPPGVAPSPSILGRKAIGRLGRPHPEPAGVCCRQRHRGEGRFEHGPATRLARRDRVTDVRLTCCLPPSVRPALGKNRRSKSKGSLPKFCPTPPSGSAWRTATRFSRISPERCARTTSGCWRATGSSARCPPTICRRAASRIGTSSPRGHMTATNAVIVIASAAGLLRFSYATISIPYAAKSDCRRRRSPCGSCRARISAGEHRVLRMGNFLRATVFLLAHGSLARSKERPPASGPQPPPTRRQRASPAEHRWF